MPTKTKGKKKKKRRADGAREPSRAAFPAADAMVDEGEEAEGKPLEFEDPFADEFIEEHIVDSDAQGQGAAAGSAGAGDDEQEDDGSGRKFWRAGVDPIAADEELDYDSTAYAMFHRLSSEWPCLSFDFMRDELGMNRTRFPMTLYAVSGTQAESAEQNSLCVMKLSDLHRTTHEDDSEADSDDDHLDDDPVLESRNVPHPGGVNRVRCMPQKPAVVASWADTADVHIWDVSYQRALLDGPPTGAPIGEPAPIQSFAGHAEEGFALAWSPVSAGRLASGDGAGAIHVWSPTDAGLCGWEVGAAPYVGHTAAVEDIAWSPTEGNVLMSCSVDKTVRVWDTRCTERSMLSVEAHSTDVNVMSWNPTVSYLVVSGADDGTFKIWDLRNFKAESPVANFAWHRGPISSVSWHPSDESTLAVASADNSVTVWDLSLEEDAERSANALAKADAGIADLPPQLLFVHQGQSDVKELHLHPQVPGVIMSTALDGFHVFKPSNIDPGAKWTAAAEAEFDDAGEGGGSAAALPPAAPAATS